MRNIVRAGSAVLAIAAIGLGAAACGDDGSGTGTAGGTTATTATATAATTTTSTATAESTAKVTLGQPEEMAITIPGTLKAGKVTFAITNGGSAPHEFVLLKTDTKAADLPTDGAKAKETGLVDRTDTLDAGATATVQANLEPGHYVVLCNVPGHYQAGMYKDVTVQ